MKLIKKIFKFIDKRFIIPITRLFVFIGDKIKITDKPFEKILSKKSSMIILSLLISVGIFLYVEKEHVTLLETNAEVINNRPLTAIYNDEEYVVEGLPKSVDVILIGTKANLYLAKQLPTKDITVDLSKLKPGKHEVKLKYKQSVSSVEYKIDPSVVTVDISIKQSETRPVDYEIVNVDKLDSKYSIKSVKLYQEEKEDKDSKKKDDKEKDDKKSIDEVIIKGTNEKIGKVYIRYDEGLECYVVEADFVKAGKTNLILEDQKGNKTVFEIDVKRDSCDIKKKDAIMANFPEPLLWGSFCTEQSCWAIQLENNPEGLT